MGTPFQWKTELVPIEELKEAIIVVKREEQNTFYIKFLTAAKTMENILHPDCWVLTLVVDI